MLHEAAIRLLAEQEADWDAEFERRFTEGRYDVYAQGEPLPDCVGVLRTRGDELAVKVVHLDFRFEPEHFQKQRKAYWLRRQAKQRQ